MQIKPILFITTHVVALLIGAFSGNFFSDDVTATSFLEREVVVKSSQCIQKNADSELQKKADEILLKKNDNKLLNQYTNNSIVEKNFVENFLNSSDIEKQIQGISLLGSGTYPGSDEILRKISADVSRSSIVRISAVFSPGAKWDSNLNEFNGLIRDSDIDVRVAAIQMAANFPESVRRKLIDPLLFELGVTRVAAQAVAILELLRSVDSAGLYQSYLTSMQSKFYASNDQIWNGYVCALPIEYKAAIGGACQ